MTAKTILFVFIAFTIGYATSPSNASDAISCDSFEGCANGSTDVTNQLLQMQAEITALQADNVELKALLLANTAADTLAHHLKYTNGDAVAATGPHFSGSHADLTNVVAAQHHTKYTNAEAVTAVGPHSSDYSALLAGVTRGVDSNTSQDTLTFTNMNVQVVNGSGITDAVTGTGNLIIGYNEIRNEQGASVTCPSDVVTDVFRECNRRTGSHMLIVGERNNYTSYGGMVVGIQNETAAKYASISGGFNNTASGSGLAASVSGGQGNSASAQGASVSGGSGNKASSSYSSISGGQSNTASGLAASVSGGSNKTASTTYCIVGDDGVDC